MMRQKNPFAKQRTKVNQWYDIVDDWHLIEASLAKQYGIRIRQHSDMPWLEFCNLVGGIMPDTPLGQIIAIRSETDKKVIRKYNKVQKQIYNEWKEKQRREFVIDEKEFEQQMKYLENIFARMFASK
mgnify:CR=1 FL=1